MTMDKKEIITIIIASIVLAVTVAFKSNNLFYASLLSFLIIISINVIAKKIAGHNFETEVKTKFWTWQQFGMRKDMHLKNPVPMAWLPLIISLFTRGLVSWLAILEFDIEAKPERAAKRHGVYRFTQVTEWHMGLIAIWGLIANLIAAIIGYIIGFELFAKLSIYFIVWNTIPIGRLDGSKIFFSNRGLWATIFIIAIMVLGWGLFI